jgi:hypothetical protein
MVKDTHWKTLVVGCLALGVSSLSLADTFTQADLDRWTKEYEAVVAKGDKLFHGGLNSKSTVSCD